MKTDIKWTSLVPKKKKQSRNRVEIEEKTYLISQAKLKFSTTKSR